MKIIKVTISAGGDRKAKYSENVIECTETPLAYKWEGTLLKKTKLNIVDSIVRNDSPNFIAYHYYCLSENVSIAKIALRDRIIADYNKFKHDTDRLAISISSIF